MSVSILEVSASYLDTADTPTELDVLFYQGLHGVRFDFKDPETGDRSVPLPGVSKNIHVTVTASLPSNVLATAIHDYLQKQPARIALWVDGGNEKDTIIFEGPELIQSESAVQQMIDELTKGSSTARVDAKRLPTPKTSASE